LSSKNSNKKSFNFINACASFSIFSINQSRCNSVNDVYICTDFQQNYNKMSIKITEECINCGACEPECPNNAIYEGGAEWRFADGTSVKGMFTAKSGLSVEADAPQQPVE